MGLDQLPIREGDGDPVQGLAASRDWSKPLYLGEQQHLAFGRIIGQRS